MYRLLFIVLLFSFTTTGRKQAPKAWIRINQLGYTPGGVKVAVWGSKEQSTLSDSRSVSNWQLIDAITKKIATSGKVGNPFGEYGPFKQTYRLNFSFFKKPGRYYLQAGGTQSPEFEIGEDVYKGAADFCLRYMRQQRSGFNPFLKDSCHTRDGYVLYGEKAGIKDSTRIDVVGGWHDASDYLQYSATSANATYHLLMSYRDFPQVFADEKLANGLDGKNGLADVLDEAKWGLDWLLKMHPKDDWLFNQIADDRDHMGMRIPKMDSFYGRGYERPVYFVSGEPQQRGKFMNNTKGTSSTAGKFSSAFSLGAVIFKKENHEYGQRLYLKSLSAYIFALRKKGVTQSASVKSPYIYAEENWVDDIELATVANSGTSNLIDAFAYARQEPITPWLGADTANHYQWYPFINIGHYELAKQLKGWRRDTIVGYYRMGIQRVWNKAKANAFYRGIPFIWCSNNLTVSFAIQCYWYRELTGDNTFSELEQANFDWLFGCNPWGTSMVYGLPSWGDTSVDPHSAFTHLKNYPIDGGLVDGPVYGNIYKNLIGIRLSDPDEYAEFQSDLVVYHDDYGDYSTNEPTMDGTASLIYLLAAKEAEVTSAKSSATGGETFEESLSNKLSESGKVPSTGRGWGRSHGAIIRGDTAKKNLAIVFTGHEFAEGADDIIQSLKKEKVRASFFFTGDFYRNNLFKKFVQQLKNEKHYLGAHSDRHLLYCDWNKRDSLLVSNEEFTKDLLDNYNEMDRAGIKKEKAHFFLPPYEWYNDAIGGWTKTLGFQLINFTPGTKSNADYTTPEMRNYRSSEEIYQSIINYELEKPAGLKGFILLLHIGTDPTRTDKFYKRLPGLIKYLKAKGYQFQTVDQLLKLD
ncbi:glycoside hydrolase family 9 protein [Terrimonas pollutisoli]|uniref:glycoside hydrolase family 9 protein n=1 Tax=Terrimonas pollutisoli TaxID=3034147 RepID=UPI0023EAC4B0|nr:glycoside hydrolase family 9 protein [Terrimonas sp. H1YJ31]